MTADDDKHHLPNSGGTSSHRWFRPALFIAVVFALTAIYFATSDEREPNPTPPDEMRMPAGKPLLEPSRPDLIGDPGIASEEEDEGDVPDE